MLARAVGILACFGVGWVVGRELRRTPRAPRAWGLTAAALLFVLVLAMTLGCAYRFQTKPPRFEGVFLYGRATYCRGDVPPQLLPQARMMSPVQPPPELPCETVEVGAKSYNDTITAIGTAIIGILAKVVLF